MLNIDYPTKGNIEVPICYPCIDSMSLSIDTVNVEILDKKLNSEIVTYFVDIDEYEDEIKPAKPFIFEQNGIRIRFSNVKHLNSKGQHIDKINITLSSKLLQTRYFQGFTSANIIIAYEVLMNMKVVKFSYEDFLNAHVSDIDICYNFRTKPTLFLQLAKYYHSLLKQGADKYYNLMRKVTKQGEILNLGLSFNERSRSTPARPYAKFYFKELELKSKSEEFYEKYLKPHNPDITNLFRLEYTIKNYKHKKRLQAKKYLSESFNTLNELLRVSRDELKKICLSFQDDYFHRDKVGRNYERAIRELSPREVFVVSLITQLIEKGSAKEDLQECLKGYDGMTKSRLKTFINKMLDHTINNTQSLEKQLENNSDLKDLIHLFE